MFNRFRNRVVLEATLKAETPLYIGAGQESFSPMAVQGSVLKNSAGMPYIPGSSIKGVLRSFLESVQPIQNCVCCNGDFKGKNERTAFGTAEQLAKYLSKKENSCLACRLFGSGVMAGKVKIADAALQDSDAFLRTELRSGNAIDRDTRTTASGALFDTEAIPAGTAFSLRVTAENLTVEEARAFRDLLLYFADGGIPVGGRSRAGLGQVRVDGIALTLYYLNGTDFAPKPKKIELANLVEEVKPYV